MQGTAAGFWEGKDRAKGNLRCFIPGKKHWEKKKPYMPDTQGEGRGR